MEAQVTKMFNSLEKTKTGIIFVKYGVLMAVTMKNKPCLW
jgi:hypothetical protein